MTPIDEFLAGLSAELPKQLPHMPLHALKADAKLFGDLAVRVPALNQPQDFALAWCEALDVLCPVHCRKSCRGPNGASLTHP